MPRAEQRDTADDVAFDGSHLLLALFAIEAAVRALLSAVVPLHAYAVLGSAFLVSVLYACLSIFGLVGSLLLPIALHRLGRRPAIMFAFIAGILCGLALAWRTPASLVVALMLQVTMNVLFEAVMNLYLLDRLQRRHIGTFESRRLLFAGIAFTVGPWLGVALNQRVTPNLSFYIVMLLSLVLLGLFWWRGPQTPASVVNLPIQPVPNPLRYVPRFIAQPRLVLAWMLAFGRSGWWIMFFIYAPIYVAAAGYPPDVGGAIVSIGLAPMLLIPLWARLARRRGLRVLLMGSFTAVGVTTMAAGFASSIPISAMMLLCVAAWWATAIDAAGNTPFLRAVHSYERASMTSVFLTFRHATLLVSPAIFALTLLVFPLGAVFVVAGIMAIGVAVLARFLPKQM